MHRSLRIDPASSQMQKFGALFTLKQWITSTDGTLVMRVVGHYKTSRAAERAAEKISSTITEV